MFVVFLDVSDSYELIVFFDVVEIYCDFLEFGIFVMIIVVVCWEEGVFRFFVKLFCCLEDVDGEVVYGFWVFV